MDGLATTPTALLLLAEVGESLVVEVAVSIAKDGHEECGGKGGEREAAAAAVASAAENCSKFSKETEGRGGV